MTSKSSGRFRSFSRGIGIISQVKSTYRMGLYFFAQKTLSGLPFVFPFSMIHRAYKNQATTSASPLSPTRINLTLLKRANPFRFLPLGACVSTTILDSTGLSPLAVGFIQ